VSDITPIKYHTVKSYLITDTLKFCVTHRLCENTKHHFTYLLAHLWIKWVRRSTYSDAYRL